MVRVMARCADFFGSKAPATPGFWAKKLPAGNGALFPNGAIVPILGPSRRLQKTSFGGRTGEGEEKHVPFFKTGKLLRDRLNGKA